MFEISLSVHHHTLQSATKIAEVGQKMASTPTLQFVALLMPHRLKPLTAALTALIRPRSHRVRRKYHNIDPCDQSLFHRFPLTILCFAFHFLSPHNHDPLSHLNQYSLNLRPPITQFTNPTKAQR
jgi:hypothetical protein